MTHSWWRLAAAGLAAALAAAVGVPGVAHADQIRELQWWLRPLRIGEAQTISRGHGVVVGLIDEAVDDSRPELKGRVLAGKGVGASYPKDGRGSSSEAHGTEMAGLIVGRSPAKNGYLGIAPDARILPFASAVSSSWTAEGLRWLTDRGAKVINISRGALGHSADEISAVQYALSHDVVVVAAAGNREGSDDVASPANIPGVIAVSAADQKGDFSSSSSFGPETVIAAPGVEMVAPAPLKVFGTGYGSPTGTSPAAAIVSGVAALMRAKYPSMTAANVTERLIRTAVDNGLPGRDEKFGFGTVRPYQALTATVPEVTESSLGSPASPSADPSSIGRGVELPSASQQSGFATKMVVAVVVGAVVLVLAALAVVLLTHKRRRRTAASGHHPQRQGGGPSMYGPDGSRTPPPPSGLPQHLAGQHYAPPPQYGPPPAAYGPMPEHHRGPQPPPYDPR